MKLRPTIFLSGVSSEFASFRDAAEIEIQKKDCFPLNQPSFETDYRTIEEILRRKIGEADAVIHIVGFRFGFEPKDRPPDQARRSYTQLEYDIARELNRPVFVFLSADASVRDPNPGEQPEDAEAAQLQLAHRQALEASNNIRYSIQDKYELCRFVGGIPLLAQADFRVDISRIDRYAPAELIGRDEELDLLNHAWLKVRLAENKRPHILTFVALGGEGKTSLVAKWAAELAFQNWPGCDSAFAWSFYSQGTREQYAASSDLFLKEGISFFGNWEDKEFAASNAGAYEKGQRLARLVGQRRALLILDGLEPLQYAPTSPIPGELKDSGIAALLRGLAADSDGLCIVTTRYSLTNLKAFRQTTAPEITLNRLSSRAGVHLLKTLGVKGSEKEFKTLVEDVKGHALTLNLLGSYLRDAHGGDIRRRDVIKLEEANTEEQGGHAFRVMQAYEVAFKNEGDKGKCALAILRLLGLFDRPMSSDCLTALLEEPAITGLTDPLVNFSEAQLNVVLTRLEDVKLLTVNRESSGALISLDAHPLLREYFARHVRTQLPESWVSANRRLYEHLCATTRDFEDPTLEDLQPLYQAVSHGCHGGLHQHVLLDLCEERIWRKEAYTVKKLGIFGSDLGAITSFFEQPWSRVSPAVLAPNQPYVFGIAAFCLRGLGRLTDALEPTRVSAEMEARNEDWKNAAISANNVSELELTLGKTAEAVKYAERSVIYADRSADLFQRLARRTTLADVLHQIGRQGEAETHFHDAEDIQGQRSSQYSLLWSLPGFRYCDLLLAPLERAAWKATLGNAHLLPDSETTQSKALRVVSQRAMQTRDWAESGQASVLTVALDNLTLGRAVLYELVLSGNTLSSIQGRNLKTTIDEAVNHLRRANHNEFIVRGLLTRAWIRLLTSALTGSESAQEDLDEAWEIAECGPMRLHMADIHLYRARLFFREEKYPWDSARKDLEAAERLIKECGYHRRDEELADAKRVILDQSV